LNVDTTRASRINKPEMQRLGEFLAITQATPVLAADIANDKELTGGFSPTGCPLHEQWLRTDVRNHNTCTLFVDLL